MEWLRGILLKIHASLTPEEDTDSCSETSSQSSSSLDAGSGSTFRTSSQSSMSAGEVNSNGSGASDSTSEDGSQDSGIQEDLQPNIASESDSDAGSQGSSGPDISNVDSSSWEESNASIPCDADTDTRSQASIESNVCAWDSKKSNRLFSCYLHRESPRHGSWCSVDLTYDWYDVDRNYNEYTDKHFWKEVIAFLNAREPAFEARSPYYCECDFHVQVSTPKHAHVKHLKQLLLELEPRYKGYSVPKLMQLFDSRFKQTRFCMQAVIEFQEKFGKEAALHMLETHGDLMHAYNY